jgi:hypothetical protein
MIADLMITVSAMVNCAEVYKLRSQYKVAKWDVDRATWMSYAHKPAARGG